jgi:high affinity Mn2+ porin
MSIADQFDNNAYSHDPASQFLNWTLVDAGAFDYAADSLGFEYGLTVELNQKAWAARVGYFTVPRVNNGLATDGHYLKAYQLAGELETLPALWPSGKGAPDWLAPAPTSR